MRSYLLGAACALGLVLCASAFTAEGAIDAPTSIVSDNGGPLREIVVQFDPNALEQVGPTYRDILRALESDVTVWVCVENDAHFGAFMDQVEEWNILGRDRFRPVVVGVPITTWSRDRFTLMQRDGRRLLMVPPRPNRGHQPRVNDWLVPFAIARAAGAQVEVMEAPMVFDGGDLAATDDVVFATALLADRNQAGDLGDRARLVRWLADTTGRVAIVLGESADEVPPHHIGMFVTPLGNGRVLVGDVDAGLALLSGDEVFPHPVDRSPETRRRFRHIAQLLAREGFEVITVPLVPLSDRITYLTFNNALLEHRADGRLHAYLPQFGVPSLDAAGRAAYEAQGVVVHPIDVSEIYPFSGTVRCLVNVLRRGPG